VQDANILKIKKNLSDIEALGGKDAVREVCNEAIEKKVKKVKKDNPSPLIAGQPGN
jgi:putative aminopeptidase FrvX